MMFLFGNRLKDKLNLMQAYEEENILLKNDVVFLRQQLEEVNLERKRLTDLILKRTGFLIEESPKETNLGEFKPIGSTRSSWPRQRAVLEQESLKRAKLNTTNNLVAPITKQELDEVDRIIGEAEKKDAS